MDILKSYDAKFVFLEKRRYIQGSSMTDGLFEAVKSWSMWPIERVQVNVHSLLKEHGRYDLFHNEEGKEYLKKKDYNAIFRLQYGKQVFSVGLRGREKPVSVSVPYDEEKLIVDCHIVRDSKAATLILNPDALVINIIIALNKKLVRTLFSSEGYGQWFLARYDLLWEKIRLLEPALLEIKAVGNIGASNTKSVINLGGETIGSIYFSRNIKYDRD